MLALLALAHAGAVSSAPLRMSPWLFEDHFDLREPYGWSSVDGAAVGDGARSLVAIEDSALVLRVRPTDERFVALTRAVRLYGSTRVHVSARMRTENVDPDVARYDDCNVFVRFPGGHVQALRVLTGTTAWTPVEGDFAVPKGASTVEVGLVLSMPGTAWFDDVDVSGNPP